MSPPSVIVCTHNRAPVVGRAVEAALIEAAAIGGEVIVVDNASSDATADVLEGLRGRSGGLLRVVREPVVGLSAARNRGLAEARGEVAAFLDDDAVPRPGWLAALLAPFTRRAVACAGGRIVVEFAGGTPAWFSPALAPAVSGFDLGDSPRRVRYGRPGDLYPYGANIAFRVSDVHVAGGFCTAVGLRGRRLFAHEETDLCYRLEEIGREIVYAPAAVVDHHVGAERLTPRWFLERHWAGGCSAAIFVLRNRGVLRALWRVGWLYGGALLPRRRPSGPPLSPRRFSEECRRHEALGYLSGLAGGLWRFRALRRDRRRSGATGLLGTMERSAHSGPDEDGDSAVMPAATSGAWSRPDGGRGERGAT
jgi:GT2 family glycosyltransferase